VVTSGNIAQLRRGSAEWSRAWVDVAAYDASLGVSESPQAGWTYLETRISASGTGLVHAFQSVTCKATQLEVQASKSYRRSAPAPRIVADCEDGIDEAGWDRAMSGGAS
jgi:hypothetical protein